MQAGARTNHLCLDLYDLPQIPHRIAEELGGAARFVIREGECPWCRLVRDEPTRPERLVWQDDDTVAFAPFASRSPFEVWVVPRRHEADFGRAGDADVAATGEALRQVLAALAVTLDGPPYNLVLHTAPLREQVDATYHWHWEIHPRLREIAGLELGTGLPVNPVSPEDAVEELLARTATLRESVAGGVGLMFATPERRAASHGGGRLVSWPRSARPPRRLDARHFSTRRIHGRRARQPDRHQPGIRWGGGHERRLGAGRRRRASSRSCSPRTTARSTPT